jgi:hypothetical protein
MKSVALLLVMVCFCTVAAAQGKPPVLVQVHFDGCDIDDLALFPDCTIREGIEKDTPKEVAKNLNDEVNRADTALYFHFISEDAPNKHATLEFLVKRNAKLSFTVTMKVVSTLGNGSEINESMPLGEPIPLQFGVPSKEWHQIIERAIDQSLSMNKAVKKFLQQTIVYGVNAILDQDQFVLPLDFGQLNNLTQAKFLISQDEDHWYCGRGTGSAKNGKFTYPAIAVIRDPIRQKTPWLQKTISCGKAVSNSNRFFVNQIDQN